MSEEYTVKYDPDGAPVVMEVIIGDQQLGSYVVKERDINTEFLRVVKEGSNFDKKPDKFYLPSQGMALIGNHIDWVMSIATPSDAPGQEYSAQVIFTQNGARLSGSPEVRNGALNGSRVVIGFVQFQSI